MHLKTGSSGFTDRPCFPTIQLCTASVKQYGTRHVTESVDVVMTAKYISATHTAGCFGERLNFLVINA